MKKIYTLLVFTLVALCASAQNYTSYFMDGTTMRGQWNPAFAPHRGYVNIPFIGSMNMGVNGNISLDDVIFKQGGKLTTILSADVPASLALSQLHEMNRLGTDINMGLFNFGAYTKNQKTFWSVDVNLKLAAEARAPYDLFAFAKNGTSGSFANLGLNVDSYLETSFSYSMPILRNLYVGARAKILLGMGRMGFNFDRFDASMGADRWYANAEGTMEVSGLIPETERTSTGQMVYNMDEMDEMSIPSGFGFGVDLGATYNLLPDLQFSLSVNDIGFMSWSKKATSVGHINKELEFTGVKIDADGNVTQPSFDLGEMDFEVVDAGGHTNALRASINLGAEYNIYKRLVSVGAFYRTKFWEYKTQHAITGAVNVRPLDWLHLSGSYTLSGQFGNSMGLALNICPGFINFFVATDMLFCKKTPQWIPIKQRSMNLSFGLGVPIGRWSER